MSFDLGAPTALAAQEALCKLSPRALTLYPVRAILTSGILTSFRKDVAL
jgi:hypothetical protein